MMLNLSQLEPQSMLRIRWNPKACSAYDGTVKFAKNNVVMKMALNVMLPQNPTFGRCSWLENTQVAILQAFQISSNLNSFLYFQEGKFVKLLLVRLFIIL